MESTNPLQKLLDQYSKKIEGIHKEKDTIIQICKDVCGITFTYKEIDLESSALRIVSHPAKRQVVFMKKNELLYTLQQQGFSSIRDIY